MKRPWARLPALLLLWLLFPGTGEVVENLSHALLFGHTAHAESVEEHRETPWDEHGCSGTFHLCACCVNLPLEATSVAHLASPSSLAPLWEATLELPLGASPDRLDHPPRA